MWTQFNWFSRYDDYRLQKKIYLQIYFYCFFFSSESDEYDDYSTQTESDASSGVQDILDTVEDILDTGDLNDETSTEEFDSTDSFVFIPETTPGIFQINL